MSFIIGFSFCLSPNVSFKFMQIQLSIWVQNSYVFFNVKHYCTRTYFFLQILRSIIDIYKKSFENVLIALHFVMQWLLNHLKFLKNPQYIVAIPIQAWLFPMLLLYQTVNIYLLMLIFEVWTFNLNIFLLTN